MATHSSVLAWRIPRMGKPGRLPSTGSRRVGHDWSDLAAAAALIYTGQIEKEQNNWIQELCFFPHFGESVVYFSNSCCSVAKSRPALCDPIDCSMPGFPVLHYLLEFAQIHVHWHWCYLTISSSADLFSFCLQCFLSSKSFQWVCSLHQVTKILETELQHQSFQWIFRIDFLWDWLVWSPCSLRDSQESSPTPQFKSINSSALSFLYSPALTSIYDYWKKHSLD